MTITKIERQKNNRSRFSIFVDGQFAFSISEDVCARFALHQGQLLTEGGRAEIEGAEAEASVKKSALHYRSFRPRSAKEIADYLKKKGFADTGIRLAIQYLSENKLLDDEAFARMLCRDRMNLRPVGRSSMRQLLFKKGIDHAVVERILDESYTVEAEHALALKEAERKVKRIASLPSLKQKKRIYEHLVRRGYDSSLSLKIASQLVKQ